jgi:phosphopantothenoylcysteine decarboxylase/phosphopantothenate--cysteine ligase
MLAGKRVLLMLGGGIAAYKSLLLIRLLKSAGVLVTPVLTRAATEFVTPLSVSALAGEKVYTDLFDLTDEAEMGHIQLSRVADLIVVSPATADLMAKMAQGRADDLDGHAGSGGAGDECADVAAPCDAAQSGRVAGGWRAVCGPG